MQARTGTTETADESGRKYRFTGYEKDTESGFDFAQARYYGGFHGRFTSPDNFTNDTHVSDPQSWNLYAYVRNNPLKFVDPMGKKETVSVSYDEQTNTTTVSIRASFSVYGTKGQKISKADLKRYTAMLKDGIEKKLKGEFNSEACRMVKS